MIIRPSQLVFQQLLNRPEYVPSPEGFISSLAWEIFSVGPVVAGKKVTGYRYKSTGFQPSKSIVEQKYTYPATDKWLEISNLLNQLGLVTAGGPSTLAPAVANSILGVKSSKSDFQPASPLSPSIALLQNYVGLLRKANPPDLGGILETLFDLGCAAGNHQSVAGQWLGAVTERMRNDPLLAKVDQVVDKFFLEAPRMPKPSMADRATLDWAKAFPKSPFVWFCEVWPRLMSPEWVNAMPARVWTDWATTTLRLSFGLGYLFEATWYDRLAREILGDEQPTWEKTTQKMGPLINWAQSDSSIENRDVSSNLKWRVQRGASILKILRDWLTMHDADNTYASADEALTAMHDDANLKSLLKSALSSRETNGSGNNLWEAIRYALLTRERTGEFADYFGLLRNHSRRYLLVDPGTEWISVVSSLASARPGSTVDLKKVIDSLNNLGLYPDQLDLLDLLERAGCARGSADADQGVSVTTAY